VVAKPEIVTHLTVTLILILESTPDRVLFQFKDFAGDRIRFGGFEYLQKYL
jgi:hypothetical protein